LTVDLVEMQKKCVAFAGKSQVSDEKDSIIWFNILRDTTI
jgi:hypothetical protein